MTYSITFFAGPLDGFETQRPAIVFHLFVPAGAMSSTAPHRLIAEQWSPGAAGYKLTWLNDQAAAYSFYGWHEPIYKLSA